MTKHKLLQTLCGATALMWTTVAMGAGGEVAPPPAAPAPGGVAPAPGGLPTLPTPDPFGAPPGALPSLPGAPLDPNAPSAASTGIPMPPPLVVNTTSFDAGTTETTATAASAGPLETYQFLFREDPELGVLREKYAFEAGEQLKQQEIDRLYTKYQAPGAAPITPVAPAPGQPPQPNAPDPKAGAAWDFYYEQLEMYSTYVKEKILPGKTDIYELQYDAANYAQEWLELAKSYNSAAIQVVNQQYNENREFYERLEEREDRRRDFYEWLADNQRTVEEWTGLWARKINGSRWADQEPVRRDDWYYGVDFNSATPVSIKIDQQDYLVSKDPQANVPREQLNVLSTNLTPYDIIDVTGTLKNPQMERLRGTLVVPPATVAVTAETAAATGTVGAETMSPSGTIAPPTSVELMAPLGGTPTAGTVQLVE